MSLPHIPVLRRGQPYESLDKVELAHVREGGPVVSLSHANAGLLRRDLRRQSRDPLRDIPAARLLEICAAAGKPFMEAELPLGESRQSPEEYIEALSSTSGLPHALCRRNMLKIHQVFTEMPTILRGLTRGMDMSVLDEGFGEQSGVPVSYFALTDSLGVVLPSNSPGVNSLWMPAIALKVPVILKPGREEPWTPFRIIQAFIAAGTPAEAFSFYPTDHEGSGAILESCGRALMFGDENTVRRYAAQPGIQVHGPGRSKILLGDDLADRWPEFLDVMVASIAENGGRSCVNASTVVVPRHAGPIAEALARELAKIVPRDYRDENALLAGFANPAMAESIDAAITEGLTGGAEDVTARHREGSRIVTRDGSTYLLPTLVKCPSFEHPLANREFLFPFASVVEVPQAKMLEQIGPSLVVTAISHDAKFIEDVIASPHVERLNIGPIPTSRVQWDQPHEGNLFEFLYRRRAIQRAAAW